mgnify:CR=1 FL=1
MLKLEAEGAEPEILMGGLNSLNLVDYITVDVTQIGSTHAGSDLQVIFTYTYT